MIRTRPGPLYTRFKLTAWYKYFTNITEIVISVKRVYPFVQSGMSDMEQRLYFTLDNRDQRVFTVKDIIEILQTSEYRARNIASFMVKKGAAERVKPGLFARVPPHIILDKKNYHEDAILIASKLIDEYFLSHYTAIQIHGLADRYSSYVYISSTSHQRSLKYHNNQIKFIKINPNRNFGVTEIEYNKEMILVSDLERTIIDIVDRPRLSGGWIEVIDCLRNLDSIDDTKLLKYLKEFNNKKTARIVGYLLDCLSNIDLPTSFNKQLHDFSGENKYYIDKNSPGSKVKEWNLVVPSRIRKEFNDQQQGY